MFHSLAILRAPFLESGYNDTEDQASNKLVLRNVLSSPYYSSYATRTSVDVFIKKRKTMICEIAALSVFQISNQFSAFKILGCILHHWSLAQNSKVLK